MDRAPHRARNMPTVGAHPVPALPSSVLASRLAAAIARRGHPASLSDADWRACAQDLDAHVVGPAELERGGQRIRVDGRTAIVTGAGVSTSHDVGPRPSARQLEAEAVLAGILREHPLCCAVSGGKDSAVTLCLALNSARRLAEAGGLRMPVIVSSADTGVESPEVVHIRTELLAAAEAFAARHAVPLITRVSTPRLTERWWPRMLAGRKLPSWAGSKADCTVDMKIKPQGRAQKEIAADLAAQGLPAPVLCVGTRYAESQRRASNMRGRGEGAELADGRIAPIANWSDVEVFDFLADVRAPKLPFDWSLLLDFYANAGAECIIVPDPALRGT